MHIVKVATRVNGEAQLYQMECSDFEDWEDAVEAVRDQIEGAWPVLALVSYKGENE